MKCSPQAGSGRTGFGGLWLSLLCLLLTLSGCVTYPDISQSRSPCRMEPGGWCAFMGDAAQDAFIYAVSSTNAYQGDSDLFDLTGSTLVLGERLTLPEEVARTGFDYQVFERYSAADDVDGRVLVERIMAFRGTDKSGVDLIYGSLRNDQRLLALEYFDMERSRNEYRDTPRWVVTGHSLGGALASEVSQNRPEIRAYAFNLSPFYGEETLLQASNRIVINERGEILRNLRRYRPAPAADMFVVNCQPEADSLAKHSISKLAACLTWIAAYRSSEAHGLFAHNVIEKPPVECGESGKEHPGLGYIQTTPCVHIGRQPRPKDQN